MRNLQIEYKFKLTKKNSAKQVTDHAMQWRGDQASIYCGRVTVTCLTPSLFFFSYLNEIKCFHTCTNLNVYTPGNQTIRKWNLMG